MDISLIPMNLENDADCTLVVGWDNDPEISPFIYPRTDETDSYPHKTGRDLYLHLKKDSGFKRHQFMIKDGNRSIGICGILVNPHILFKKVEKTAWLGLNIGDKSYWGQGVGPYVVKLMEEICLDLRIERVELGTFEFNKRALKMFLNLDYKKIGVVPNFTFFKNKMWNDVRLEKWLGTSGRIKNENKRKSKIG